MKNVFSEWMEVLIVQGLQCEVAVSSKHKGQNKRMHNVLLTRLQPQQQGYRRFAVFTDPWKVYSQQ